MRKLGKMMGNEQAGKEQLQQQSVTATKCSEGCVHCSRTAGYRVVYNDKAMAPKNDKTHSTEKPLFLAYSMGGQRIIVRL
mmetsp:Transcript_1537/g.2634  ORF Transcript_1537/g.2634 Transcript_1537/m.2634 type:complete len:80 (+) Transcript_1537:173-412(+)